MKNKKVVVIGGGQGQSTILRGIKEIDGIDLTAIVTVADDGGSTGRLRRRFHIPAMGDVRNVLISLAANETLLSQLMDYRFEVVGEDEQDLDVEGHNLGNLILTAMTDSTGSFMDAISILSKVLNVKGLLFLLHFKLLLYLRLWKMELLFKEKQIYLILIIELVRCFMIEKFMRLLWLLKLF